MNWAMGVQNFVAGAIKNNSITPKTIYLSEMKNLSLKPQKKESVIFLEELQQKTKLNFSTAL